MLERVSKKMWLINSKLFLNIIWIEKVFFLSSNCMAMTSLQFDFKKSETLRKAS